MYICDFYNNGGGTQEALTERDTLRDQLCKLKDENGGIMGCISQLKTTSEELNFERDELNESNRSLREQIQKLQDQLHQIHKVLFSFSLLLFMKFLCAANFSRLVSCLVAP